MAITKRLTAGKTARKAKASTTARKAIVRQAPGSKGGVIRR